MIFSGTVKMIASFQEFVRFEQMVFGREIERVFSVKDIWVVWSESDESEKEVFCKEDPEIGKEEAPN